MPQIPCKDRGLKYFDQMLVIGLNSNSILYDSYLSRIYILDS